MFSYRHNRRTMTKVLKQKALCLWILLIIGLLLICKYLGFLTTLSKHLVPEVNFKHNLSSAQPQALRGGLEFGSGKNTENSPRDDLISNNGHCTDIQYKEPEEEEFFRLDRSKGRAMPSTFLINARGICESKEKLFAVFLVLSTAKDQEYRTAIRKLWGPASNRRTIFLFGEGSVADDKILKNESENFGDIVQGDFKDKAENLPLKVIFGFKWVTVFCSNIAFVVVVNKDIFIDIPVLVDFLKTNPPDANVGTIYGNVTRIDLSNSTDDNHVYSEYPLSCSPVFTGGHGWVVSRNLVGRMTTLAEFTPFYHAEDIFITGILRRVLNANFKPFCVVRHASSDVCSYESSGAIIASNFTPTEIMDSWRSLKKKTP